MRDLLATELGAKETAVEAAANPSILAM